MVMVNFHFSVTGGESNPATHVHNIGILIYLSSKIFNFFTLFRKKIITPSNKYPGHCDRGFEEETKVGVYFISEISTSVYCSYSFSSSL